VRIILSKEQKGFLRLAAMVLAWIVFARLLGWFGSVSQGEHGPKGVGVGILLTGSILATPVLAIWIIFYIRRKNKTKETEHRL
jgi:F0F1-type ATP synthase membrane subunit a